MKALSELCKPRKNIFDRKRRDIVLDLTDLVDKKVDAQKFFDENYVTAGMKTLLSEAFKRFDGKSPQGVFVLSQAMGGGKTHNMIALALLAKNPQLREKVMGSDYQAKTLGKVRVVAFTGRESDAPLGVWGAVAEQLGKKELFKDYYSPLSAPGQSAWINLLKGEPLLILLDELPPYLENAKAKMIGNSDLSRVTTTALANLLVAVGKDELSNICVVISDLRATYEEGSRQISHVLKNLGEEINRSAMQLEPVALNTPEIYHILRKRLFEEVPEEKEIWEIARAYAAAVENAKQMDITNASPQQFAQDIKESYPFHFAIRDLYARFRENPGFQQTRGLIRLMRVLVSRIFDPKNGAAAKQYLIHAHDFDLNDPDTHAEILAINRALDNAISHDIASKGQASAEIFDAQLQGNDAQDVCKLLLISSLANIPNAMIGLLPGEAVSYLCIPDRKVSHLQRDVIEKLRANACWYLHRNADGRLYFSDVQNLNARLKNMAQAYNRESCLRELREFLGKIFAPDRYRDCYQEVSPLPALDEIKIKPEKVTLIIYEPYEGSKMSPDLQKFYDNLEYKNRVLFLSGQRSTLQTLLDRAAELKAIQTILQEMDAKKVPNGDPQRIEALDIRDNTELSLLSAARETFTTLFYPHGTNMVTADFGMNFTDNHYHGETQIRETLKTRQKFTEDIGGDTFQKKCEKRLFTAKIMLWSEVKRRAAMDISWQWHRPDALDELKADLVHRDQWRESGNSVEKPPFPKPQTQVRIKVLDRDDTTGEATLKIEPVYGDVVHYEMGGQATKASLKVADLKQFKTKELEMSFLCFDSTGEHEIGSAMIWQNSITIRHKIFRKGKTKMMELKAIPDAEIRYSTDGSQPDNGAVYAGPFEIPKGTICVLAIAKKGNVSSKPVRLDIEDKGEVPIDPGRPVSWKRHFSLDNTKEAYEFLKRLQKCCACALNVRVLIEADNRWVEITFDREFSLEGAKIETAINQLRQLLSQGNVTIEVEKLDFVKGQDLLDWVAEIKSDLKPGEIEQVAGD
jgi:hypothetical protein